MTDFDRVMDRTGTGSLKWGWLPDGKAIGDVIPLWVADMDFPPPDEVLEALRARMNHPFFGYTNPSPEYFRLLEAWYASRYGAKTGKEAFLLGPGAVASLGIAVRTFTEPGGGILVMPPVYHPFSDIIRGNGRIIVEAPLKRNPAGGRLTFDPETLEAAVSAARARGLQTRMILFCSPHNPGGTVWRREELEDLLRFARAHEMILVSDEIHGDLVFPPNRFITLAGFPGAGERTVVISAPNKTFNMAGLHTSHFVVTDEPLRLRLRAGVAAAGYSQPNIFSLTAAEAAYRSGGPWLDALLRYLKANLEFTVRYVNERVPGAAAFMPEGTYLVWVDAGRLVERKHLSGDRDLVSRLETEAGVKFTAGSVFGSGGSGFLRINTATPRSILERGLERLSRWASS